MIKYFFLLLPFFIFSCQQPEITFTEKDVFGLKNEYSIDELNYFYETVFYSDFDRTIVRNVKKWNKDIKLFYYGEFSAIDEQDIKNTINQMNALQLPIKIHIVDSKRNANVVMFLGDRKEVLQNFGKESEFGIVQGYGETYHKNGIIQSASIGIINEFKGSLRKDLIFEELIQILGIQGDSHSYRNSVVYEKQNSVSQFSTLDIKVIKLLYDKRIPSGVSISEFENKFSDVLRPIEASKKINAFLVENKVPIKSLRLIAENHFINDTLYKFSKDIPVYINSDIAFDQSEIPGYLKTISSAINCNVYLGDVNNPTYDGVFIKISENPELEKNMDPETSVNWGIGMYPKLVKSNVHIETKNNINTQALVNPIVNGIVKSLGLLYLKEDVLNEDKNLKKEYLKSLHLIYNDVFPDGLSLQEFNQIFTKYLTNQNEKI